MMAFAVLFEVYYEVCVMNPRDASCLQSLCCGVVTHCTASCLQSLCHGVLKLLDNFPACLKFRRDFSLDFSAIVINVQVVVHA